MSESITLARGELVRAFRPSMFLQATHAHDVRIERLTTLMLTTLAPGGQSGLSLKFALIRRSDNPN